MILKSFWLWERDSHVKIFLQTNNEMENRNRKASECVKSNQALASDIKLLTTTRCHSPHFVLMQKR